MRWQRVWTSRSLKLLCQMDKLKMASETSSMLMMKKRNIYSLLITHEMVRTGQHWRSPRMCQRAHHSQHSHSWTARRFRRERKGFMSSKMRTMPVLSSIRRPHSTFRAWTTLKASSSSTKSTLKRRITKQINRITKMAISILKRNLKARLKVIKNKLKMRA